MTTAPPVLGIGLKAFKRARCEKVDLRYAEHYLEPAQIDELPEA